jgi:hypothetical protein
MSVIKFELKEEHVKLLKNLRWSMKDDLIVNMNHDGEEYVPPFGEDTIYEAIDIILNGFRDEEKSFKIQTEGFSDEQKAEWDKLYSELPTALDIVLYNGSYELGTYKTKWHFRNWVKIN